MSGSALLNLVGLVTFGVSALRAKVFPVVAAVLIVLGRAALALVQAVMRFVVGKVPRRIAHVVGFVAGVLLLVPAARLWLGGAGSVVAAASSALLDVDAMTIAFARAAPAAGPWRETATAIAIGEVGLAGDLRRVSGMDRRLAEAARLGFTDAIVPPGVKDVPAGLRLTTADNIGAALRALKSIGNNGGRS